VKAEKKATAAATWEEGASEKKERAKAAQAKAKKAENDFWRCNENE